MTKLSLEEMEVVEGGGMAQTLCRAHGAGSIGVSIAAHAFGMVVPVAFAWYIVAASAACLAV